MSVSAFIMKPWISETTRGAGEMGAAGRERAKDIGFRSEYFLGWWHGLTFELYLPPMLFDLIRKTNGTTR